MYLTLKDLFRMFFNSLLITLVVALFITLISRNIEFANYLCNTMNIPKDFAITIVSPGFANEIVILSTISELGIILYIYFKIINNKRIMDFYDRVIY